MKLRVKIDNFTYQQMTESVKLPLIVISAYNYGGGTIDLDKSWLDNTALEKAKKMNIAAVVLSYRQKEIYDNFLNGYKK